MDWETSKPDPLPKRGDKGWGRVYRLYLRSFQWGARRALVFERAQGRCERCRLARIEEVHHKTYEHFGNEPLEDLEGLCLSCHVEHHFFERTGRTKKRKTKKRQGRKGKPRVTSDPGRWDEENGALLARLLERQERPYRPGSHVSFDKRLTRRQRGKMNRQEDWTTGRHLRG